MTVKQLAGRAARFMAIASNNPEVLKAQCAVLSRLIPLMYFILVASSWTLTANYIDRAPIWLTVYAALALTAICAVRLSIWWRKRGTTLTTEMAIRELKRTNRMAAILGAAFSAWAFALFPYGDAFAQSHVAFFLAILMIGCIVCLIHLRSAAVTLAAVVGTAFVVFFATTGNPTFIAMAINLTLVTAALLIVVAIRTREFTRMVVARADATTLLQEQGRLLRMIDGMPVAVMTVDPKTFDITYANETSRRTIAQIEDLLPINADELRGTSIDVFHKHPEYQRKILADPANLPHNARIRLGPETLDLRVSAVNAADGSYIGPMLTWAIVTKEVAAENHIRQLAHYDTLTGLANRNSVHEQLEANLTKPDNRIGLLLIDLDDLKIVNDTRGHRVGDALLKQVAERLRVACDGPSTIVGRLGGDKFAVMIQHDDPDQAAVLAEALVNILSIPYCLDDSRTVRIGASIGIALAPVHAEDTEMLMSRADIALYSAKAAGKGTHKMFLPAMEARIQARVHLEAKLRAALEADNGLFVFYQPIINIETGKVTAREALVRWHDGERGWISPGEFIPVAENSGLIDRLGLWVLNRACSDAAAWPDGARVAVNVSAGPVRQRRAHPGGAGGAGQLRPVTGPVGNRGHRNRAAARRTRRHRRPVPVARHRRAGGPRRFRDPAIPRWPICALSPSTRSRSTAPLCATPSIGRIAPRSSRPSPIWASASASPPSPKASRPRPTSIASGRKGAARSRDISTGRRCRATPTPRAWTNSTAGSLNLPSARRTTSTSAIISRFIRPTRRTRSNVRQSRTSSRPSGSIQRNQPVHTARPLPEEPD